MLTVEKERAASLGYRKRIERKLFELKEQQENISTLLAHESIGNKDHQVLYYSGWIWISLHILLSVPKFQDLDSLASRTGLPKDQVRIYLEMLEKMNLVKRDANRWRSLPGNLHLPKESPLIALHHNNWRQKSVMDAQINQKESLHYTTIVSLSIADADKLKQTLLEFISSFQRVVGPSKEEEVFCFATDFFKV